MRTREHSAYTLGMEVGEGVDVSVWEGGWVCEDEGGMEEVGSRQPDKGRGKRGGDREWGGDSSRTMEGREVDTEETAVERRWREGDAKPRGDGRAGRDGNWRNMENVGKREKLVRGDTVRKAGAVTAGPAKIGVGGGRRRWRSGEYARDTAEKWEGYMFLSMLVHFPIHLRVGARAQGGLLRGDPERCGGCR